MSEDKSKKFKRTSVTWTCGISPKNTSYINDCVSTDGIPIKGKPVKRSSPLRLAFSFYKNWTLNPAK